MPPRKRRIDEIATLREPAFSAEASEHMREGIDLFNAGRYWHAHEAWENAWLTMPNDASGDAEIILRGLIQLAAALHLVGERRLDGAASNLGKAREKLVLAPACFMGIAIAPLIPFIDQQRDRLDRVLPCSIDRC
jgi:predicted metal-dependent hydrolase